MKKDYNSKQYILELFTEYNLVLGRLISYSKSTYRKVHPNNLVLFNANIFTESLGKIWHGDLDVTKDEKKLQIICNNIGEDLYILSEMDGRFENEDRKFEGVKKVAVKVIKTT